MHAAGLSRVPPRRWRWLALAIVAFTAAAAAVPAFSQNIKVPQAAKATGQLVPDPSALKPGWWDFLAPTEPGIEERVKALLSGAADASARLPPDLASPAGHALERLRISLSALPGMLAARPAAPGAVAAPATHYTTRQILQLDRDIRNLRIDLDERRSAITASDRAMRDAQRQLDTDFAAYMAEDGSGPGRIVDGLEVMATRAEIAITAAEQRLRTAEDEALVARIAEMTALRDRGLTRIIPDPARTAAQIQELVVRNQRALESQREQILRTRAERSNLASQPDASKAELQLADLRITAAMIEEAFLRTTIGLYETELDWLTISARGLDTTAAAAMARRLAERRQELRETETELTEWIAVVQRIIATGLPTPATDLHGAEPGTDTELLNLAQATITRIIQLRSVMADVKFGSSVAVNLLSQTSGWRGWLRTGVLNPIAEGLTRTSSWLSATLFRIGDTPVTAFGLLRVVLFLIFASLLSRFIRYLLARFGARDPGRPSAGLYTLGRLLHYLLIAAAIVIGLASIGLDFSQVALVAGALSIGIGFGLQSIVNNFVSGLMILFEQNLKVGDVVELDSGVRGAVREINVRSTLISTSDGVDIVVPNSEFISGKVTNYTLREPFHRIHVPFGVAYGSDKEEVRRVVAEAARAVPYTHIRPGREPEVWLVRFGDNSLNFELVVWINPAAVTRPGAVMATYLWEIETILNRHGIAIPFPQREVHLRVSPS